ncbi:ATP-dependent RNA helicase DDX51 [Porphyridium purpureum]|uniref:ATP-dependent RNA helicase n=1 Tax=Porphyridium purpureum TaxID=35688 RepID=A0A5J4YLL8_PORPP|nr:ATP-dependent RNA helicase DDX51 [Porphyridium purpureum]|eukprot:POR9141..scf244_11
MDELGEYDVLIHPDTDATAGATRDNAKIHHLDARVELNLRRKCGVTALFKMQQRVVAHLLRLDAMQQSGDVVLCAPTGSGKTLAYALPLMNCVVTQANSLRCSTRECRTLRALVLVPTRDLALQVVGVLSALAHKTGVRVVAMTGQSSFSQEAKALVEAHPCLPGVFQSATEIIVATPGRLVHHLQRTAGFSLLDLEYIVVDESDRLLNQSYFDWADTLVRNLKMRVEEDAPRDEVLWASFRRFRPLRKVLASATQTSNPKKFAKLELHCVTRFFLTADDATASTEQAKCAEPATPSEGARISSHVDDGTDTGAQSTVAKYHIPVTLTENVLVCASKAEKLHALYVALGLIPVRDSQSKRIFEMGFGTMHGRKVVFVKSREVAHRLTRLLELTLPLESEAGANVRVLEFSSELSAERRNLVLSVLNSMECDATKRKLRDVVVICSDAMSRGMDITHLDVVVNYDAPGHARTYTHRVGRSARAGRDGVAVSLITAQQAYHFKRMQAGIKRRDAMRYVPFDAAAWIEQHGAISRQIGAALANVNTVLKREAISLLDPTRTLPLFALREFQCALDSRSLELAAAGAQEPDDGYDEVMGYDVEDATWENDTASQVRTQDHADRSQLLRALVQKRLLD